MPNNLSKLGLLVFSIVAISLTADAYSVTNSYPHNLNAALDYYGFKKPEQKQAIRFLMRESGIQDVDSLLDGNIADKNALIQKILDFVSATQNKFTIRTGSQERWDIETAKWMKDPVRQAQILAALETLGIMDAVPPIFEKRAAICILGATKKTMAARLEYAGNLYVEDKLSAEWLIMLAGERYVTPDKNGDALDGSKQELILLANKIGKNISALTETDLMRAEYESSKLYGRFPNHEVLIDTPKRDLPRPTTETTIMALCDWLQQHPEVQSITFVSNQPHVEYQKNIIAQVFVKRAMQVNFEVIGDKYQIDLENNIADKINYIIQALGSSIWAATPKVIHDIGLDVSDKELMAKYLDLYKKQPLIYNNLYSKLIAKPKL